MAERQQEFGLRLAREAELPRLKEIDDSGEALFRAAGLVLEFSPDHPLVLEELSRWRRGILEGRCWVLVDQSDHSVGFASVGEVDGAPYLEQLGIHSNYQRQGLGRRLMCWVLSSYALQAEFLSLTTYAHLPWNAPFYQSLGFFRLEEGQCGAELQTILKKQRDHLPEPQQRVPMRYTF